MSMDRNRQDGAPHQPRRHGFGYALLAAVIAWAAILAPIGWGLGWW